MARSRKQFKSGVYRPFNSQKFGESKCVYRSSFELDFLKWCDQNSKVMDVKYEKVIIPYLCKTDGKMHRYYVDCKIVLKETNGLKTYLIEIKPFNQTLPPKESKRKKKTTIIYEHLAWAKNTSKWDYAKQFCKKHNYRWCILTERGIYIDDKFFEGKMFGKTK
jgi:hypothetical protein